MDNETLFYVCGIALAVSAVLISFIGLKAKGFPGKAFPVVILWFAILVGGATTFSVLHAQDEEHHKAAEFEQAGEEFEAEGAEDAGAAAPAEEEEAGKAAGEEESPASAGAAAEGPGGTLALAADPSAIAYDKTALVSAPGEVTIDFTNPAALEHDVAIEDESGEELAGSDLIGEGETSVSAELAPGLYTFFCTVPGHREAGMEGTLTV
ncbi:MAG TPA: plastocyanin/azurin family copper-binding protein, partial [Solirubrobacterales bacterium]|nr:plastocyanin/azurin family copper-binding protein [Solirubrobacterales bacterium]